MRIKKILSGFTHYPELGVLSPRKDYNTANGRWISSFWFHEAATFQPQNFPRVQYKVLLQVLSIRLTSLHIIQSANYLSGDFMGLGEFL
jgi:hypothetical protein